MSSEHGTHSEGEAGSTTDSAGIDKQAGSKEVAAISGNSQIPQEAYNGETWSKEHAPSSSHDDGSKTRRQATNHLNGQSETPFAGIDADLRRRIEARTGRSLEASYEGFTELVGFAVDELFRREVG